ncbi:cytochrome c oxidase assembly factor 4 homolog, mitochondrial [Apteryx rowi]|uniref:cytochrome c oxidase assembly factor 4 homolog, mitochondrial n=1 Tax=Apteryx rowi TaxID=308060 RepID=UPI000E1DB23F|nr:cytochrome c oxidase assembly factor 4 homolog, mitochondrial [Apteryx rowi]
MPGPGHKWSRPAKKEEEEEEEEEDPVDAMIARTGCTAQHHAVQECMAAQQDWRRCQVQVQAFRACMAERQRQRAEELRGRQRSGSADS